VARPGRFSGIERTATFGLVEWAWENGTRVLGSSDIERAADILVRAFANDPLHRFQVGARPDGPKVSRALMLHTLVPMTRAGRVYGIGHPLVGVAIMIPGPFRGGWRSIIPMAAFALRFGLGVFGRSLQAEIAFARGRPRRPHMYLGSVAVDPDHQRQGVGRRLVTGLLNRAVWQATTEVYLETSLVQTIVFYEACGFVLGEELQVGGGGPRSWAMSWRYAPEG
jgi:GNAT superfamily N-acetyltransferase